MCCAAIEFMMLGTQKRIGRKEIGIIKDFILSRGMIFK